MAPPRTTTGYAGPTGYTSTGLGVRDERGNAMDLNASQNMQVDISTMSQALERELGMAAPPRNPPGVSSTSYFMPSPPTNFAPRPNADADVFSFLAGTFTTPNTGRTAVPGPMLAAQDSSGQLPFQQQQTAVVNGSTQAITDASGKPPRAISSADLGMLMRTIQSFVPEFQRLELGDAATRANRLLTWRTTVTEAINPAGPILIEWWNWCLKEAEVAHQSFLLAPISTREAIMPSAPMPTAWLQLEAWMRPHVVKSLPQHLTEWVTMRARQGHIDPSHVLIY